MLVRVQVPPSAPNLLNWWFVLNLLNLFFLNIERKAFLSMFKKNKLRRFKTNHQLSKFGAEGGT